MIRGLIFDWGGTVMADFDYPGAMFLWPEVAWVPGAREALDQLHDRFSCSIATNAGVSGTGEMILALDRIGASRYFRFFFSSRELGVRKPDPRFFEIICQRMGLLPEECIMIGNDFRKDIEGAREAGMKAIFYDPEGHSLITGPGILTIRSMNDLPTMILKIIRDEEEQTIR